MQSMEEVVERISWGGVVSVVFFYAVMYVVGKRAARHHRETVAEDLMLARRSIPVWLGVFTMSATWVGGGYVNGTAEAVYSSGLVWAQAPWGYALSLVVGGVVFARVMRRHRFTTMLDPVEQRYGRRVAALLYVPALTGELFWTGAILTALGSTFGTVLGLDFGPAVVVSAGVAVAYTLTGGLWSVAVTDVLQLTLLVAGLWLVVPVALTHVDGLDTAWQLYSREYAVSLVPPWGGWRDPDWGDAYWSWWDSALLLVFGGVAWHVYFQRVLSAASERVAANLSLFAGGMCIVAAVPAALIGMVGAVADWSAVGVPPPEPPMVLPYVLRYLTNPLVASIGLGALAAAVMSSIDSSMLSAASMGAWNVYRPFLNPSVDAAKLVYVIRRLIVIVGVAATLIALRIESVYALWFLCSDFVYCILFPQLTTALFDKQANRYGALAGLAVSFCLRFGGGEPTLGLPRVIPYPMVDPLSDTVLFPFRTFSMVAGLVAIVVVSRLTKRVCPPRPLLQPDVIPEEERG